MGSEIVLLCRSGEAGRWPNDKDPTGYWISEKLDGLRALWDGKRLLSRYNNTFPAPEYFIKGFPSIPLDGELWLGYHRFEETSSIVRNGSRDNGWSKMSYHVFDIPDPRLGPCERRWQLLEKLVKDAGLPNLVFVPQIRCTGPQHMVDMMVEVLGKKGEGLMLRRPGSLYEKGRSSTILKFKNFIDDEATVTGIEEIEVNTPDKFHLRGAMGALICLSKSGKTFKIGSGFTDEQRLHPPKVGSLVTYRYQELTAKGIPRHPRFVAVRDYE